MEHFFCLTKRKDKSKNQFRVFKSFLTRKTNYKIHFERIYISKILYLQTHFIRKWSFICKDNTKSTDITVMKSLFSILVITLFTFTLQAQKLTNELIWYSREFSPDYVGGLNSLNDGEHYVALEQNQESGETEIVKYSYKTGEPVSIIASASDIFGATQHNIQGYSFSKDETQLLIETEVESIYRYSYLANFFIYDIATKKRTPLTDFSKGKQRLAEFSPDGTKVAFVRENDLYYYDLKTKEEIKVTNDGKKNAIINGYPDWVYEEEFGFSKGFYWSPNSDHLAYYRFDESEVKEYSMPIYGDDSYPQMYTFKYPKAGEKNSTVQIHIYDLPTKKNLPVLLGKDTDIYIPRIKWTKNNDHLCIMRMNRHQNHLEFLMAIYSSKLTDNIRPKVFYDETSETYIDINDNLIFSKDGKHFYWNSKKSGFNHIYQFAINGSSEKALTSGNWEVNEFLGVDEKNGVFYYTSGEESPLEQHLYRKGLDSKTFKNLTPKKGWNDASFSNGFKYFINVHTDANTPYYITLHQAKGKEIRVLVDNAEFIKTINKYHPSPKEFFTFKNSEGIELNCWMIKPPNFDPNKEYPVYVNIYGGPGSNMVKDSWAGRNYLWHQLLAQQGYIVASCDPRGTMYRGKKFEHSTYLQLGKLETEDFIDFAKYLGHQTYIDKNRIGIQGWSYGGYMTSLCMTKGADYYKAGIAVAPVTNWKYYDSIYTERFMRTPQENNDGYENNSPINHTEKLKGPFLIIHGSADDNVHLQNTMNMVETLVAQNKDFEMFIYPNKNHGIYGGTTRLNLFNKILAFTLENI